MPKTTSKNKNRPLLVANEENLLSGKKLQDMGKRVDSDGFLIAATSNYSVRIIPGNWIIKLRPKRR